MMSIQSSYGSSLGYIWKGFLPVDKVILQEISSTLNTSELGSLIKEKWDSIKAKNPKAYSDTLLRFEQYTEKDGVLTIGVSETDYKTHKALSGIEDLATTLYPTPIGVTLLQKTSDGYVVMGYHAAKKAIDSVGSGWIKPGETVEEAAMREACEETIYVGGLKIKDEPSVIALISGSLRDVGVGVLYSLDYKRGDVSLSKEHEELIYLPANKQAIEKVLTNGKLNEVLVVDQALGMLERYLELGLAD
ncbi:TPA: NUDIX hydrolase [Candidatus Woesearchaeota archaeon]|nr:NUDIX hydrolase [Candidatus Woesearchaeota archaeon]